MKTNVPRVLIVSVNPYSNSSITRAYETYFGLLGKNNLIQIYTNNSTPDFNKVSSYFQITDLDVLKRMFSFKKHNTNNVGKIVESKHFISNKKRKSNVIVNVLKNTFIFHLLRRKIWQAKYWFSSNMKKWIENFKPNILFLHNSDSFFINEMALNLCEHYNIPLVFEISDDYIFNKSFSLSPFYYIYKKKYETVFKKIIYRAKKVIYVSNKMKSKYDATYNISGEVVHISTKIQNTNFDCQQLDKLKIRYFGNIFGGRLSKIIDISKIVQKIDPNIIIEIYCPNNSRNNALKTNRYKNLLFLGNIPYEKVIELTKSALAVIVVDGSSKRNMLNCRYSLSTKTADALIYSNCIIGYGPKESGTISFLLENSIDFVSTNKKDLEKKINNFLKCNKSNKIKERYLYVAKKYFDINVNKKICYDIFLDCLNYE